MSYIHYSFTNYSIFLLSPDSQGHKDLIASSSRPLPLIPTGTHYDTPRYQNSKEESDLNDNYSQLQHDLGTPDNPNASSSLVSYIHVIVPYKLWICFLGYQPIHPAY